MASTYTNSTKSLSDIKEKLESGIAVVIPCYREKAHILRVLSEIGHETKVIYVIDDACPDKTGDFVQEKCEDKRVEVLRNNKNLGVGGATKVGYRKAIEDGAKYIVKLDGDGQMSPSFIPSLVKPLANGNADYVKGNRFYSLNGVENMPKSRLLGNFVLSFVSKLSSGYWNIFDPTNGFTAIHAETAQKLPMEKISERYFFESDMLFHLGLLRAVVKDIPIQAHYGDETSGIFIPKIVPEFIFKHYLNTWRRIFVTYFVRETNIATLQLILGGLFLAFGIVFGGINWILSETSGIEASAGTVALSVLTIIVGSQLMVAFLSYDTRNVPNTPLQQRANGSKKTDRGLEGINDTTR